MGRFSIMGTEIPPMLGRSKIMHRLWTNLTKPTPSNLSLVGPRYAGKSVIMKSLAERAGGQGSPYKYVAYWHLGHATPDSNENYIAQLCERLRECFSCSKEDTSIYRKHLEEHTFSNLVEVLDLLDSENKSVLMLWDGFDKPLGQGKLTANLWEQMRTLFYGRKHKIVTATRKPLSELLRSPEVITSPFWNIFDLNPVRVEVFDENDIEVILEQMPEHSFQSGAKTELINWSGCCPTLILGILNQISIDAPKGQIDNQAVKNASIGAADSLSGLISEIWDDCPASAKDLFVRLMESGFLPLADAGKEERRCLIEKGFALHQGNRLTASCRLLQEHIRSLVPDSGAMARLFGTWESYRSNIRGLLERRLAQISHFDGLLVHLVSQVIEDIPEYADQCLNNLTSIEERALDLIWQREFGLSKIISQEIIGYWNKANPGDKILQRLNLQIGSTVPLDRTLQCGLLQLLTGSKLGFDSKAQHISKDTYVLVNAIHSFRNRGQHADGQSMHLGVAVAAIIICVELLACLDRELIS